jgi:hypothetical protein
MTDNSDERTELRSSVAAPPVKKQTVLDKICFVRFGQGGLKAHGQALKQELYDFRNRREISYITHPTILNWCEKGHHPSRPAAFKFLYEYFAEELQKLSLSEARSKVRNQIAAFLKTTIERAEQHHAIYRAKDGRYVFGLKTSAQVIDRLSNTIVGHYFTYRVRFGAHVDNPIARELLCISLGHQSLNFQHWHRRDDRKVISFDGCIVPVGDILWFFGANSKPANRMRIMHFRDTKGVGSKAGSLRWGILCSDVPQPLSEPASTRIIMYRAGNEFPNPEVAAEQYVSYVSYSEFPEDVRPIMQRLLSNSRTSKSKYGSIEPASSENGEELQDKVLTVDQHTIVAATRKILELGGLERTRSESEQQGNSI